jgi:hypothetical protein
LNRRENFNAQVDEKKFSRFFAAASVISLSYLSVVYKLTLRKDGETKMNLLNLNFSKSSILVFLPSCA